MIFKQLGVNDESLGKWMAIGRLFLKNRQFNLVEKATKYSQGLHKKEFEIAI